MIDSFYRLRGMTSEIQNNDLRGLAEYFLDKVEFREAKGGSCHHDYTGGLVDHTLEVANMAMSIYESSGVKDKLSRDFLLTGAMLHDIGKVGMDYEEFRRAGAAHCAVGAYMVSEACKNRGVPDKLRRLLVALIIEHGGARDSVKFSTRESYIIYAVDTISASICASDAHGATVAALWDEIRVVEV